MGLARIEELFSEGTTIVVRGSKGNMPFWVKKLNAFERDEAIKDARGARARRMLAFDRDENEQAAMEVMLSEMSKDELVEDLLQRKAGTFMIEADAAVRAEKEWQERVLALDRSDVEGSKPSESEQRAMDQIATEFQGAVLLEQQSRLRQQKSDYDAMSIDALHKEYRKAWREMQGATAFHEEKTVTEAWYALHYVTVDFDEDDNPIEETAKPGARVLDSRDGVARLPDVVMAEVAKALAGQPSEEQAKN